jgi:predicted lipase
MFFKLFFLIFFSFFLETLSFIGLKNPFFARNIFKPKNYSNHFTPNIPIHDMYKCAQLSELAYEFDNIFKNKDDYLNIINKNNHKCPESKFIRFIKNKTNLHCLITENKHDKTYTVIFKGTNKLINWFYNIKTDKMKINDGVYVHRGFYLQLLNDNVIRQIEKIMLNSPKDYKWIFCGHSAGGAHSIITSYLLAKKFPNRNISTFTFASPRVGNINFAENFEGLNNLDHWRISYRNDIFTALPIIDYHHVGNSMRLYPDKFYIGDYIKWFTFSLLKCHSFFDHDTAYYTKELAKLVDKL